MKSFVPVAGVDVSKRFINLMCSESGKSRMTG